MAPLSSPEMAEKLTLDLKLREQAKALFLGGANTLQTAEALGLKESTIKTWAYRYKWATVRRQAKPLLQSLVVQEQVKVSAGIAKGLEEEGRKLRQSLSQDLQRTAGRLAGQWTSPDSIREELERSQVVRQVAAVAAQVYGWDRESVTSTVRVGAMGEEGDEPSAQVAVADDAH